MGTWGTGLSSNDAFEDIYSEFISLYNSGLEIPEITNNILSANVDLQNDYEDKHSFWFALAKAQWECGALDQEIYKKVKTIIESGEDLKLWIELNGASNDVSKRKKVLEGFLQKISTPTAKIKKRKKLIIRKPVFQKGDCVIFTLANGNYGGAFVLEAEQGTDLGMNMLAVTTLNQINKPTTLEFETADILTQKQEGFPGKYRERACIIWCYVQFYKKAQTRFEVIGQLSVDKLYNSREHCHWIGQWDTIPKFLNDLESFEKEHGKAALKVTLKEWR
jgi:Zn-finger protein